MTLMKLRSFQWLLACACSIALVPALSGCSKGDSDVGPDAPKLGTDKLPQAPGQGGDVKADGTVAAPQTAKLPPKGGH